MSSEWSARPEPAIVPWPAIFVVVALGLTAGGCTLPGLVHQSPTIVLEPRLSAPVNAVHQDWYYHANYDDPNVPPVIITSQGSIFRSKDQARSTCWLRTDLLGKIRGVTIVDSADKSEPLTDVVFTSETHKITAHVLPSDDEDGPDENLLRWTVDENDYHYCDRNHFSGLSVETATLNRTDKLAAQLVEFDGTIAAFNGATAIDLTNKKILFRLRGPRAE